MAGPVLQVLLADATGAFTYDITKYVDLTLGVSITRGRQDEMGEIDPSRLTLTVKNVDGRFTIGSATYGIRVDQRIRVIETIGGVSYTRFTGYVQDWPLEFPSPSATYTEVPVTAVDRQARLQRHKLRTRIEEAVLKRAPVAYYTLAEPQGSPSAGDTSGHVRESLTVYTPSSSTPLVFGEATATEWDGLTAVRFGAAPSQSLVANSLAVSGNVWSYLFFTTLSSAGSWVSLSGDGISLRVGLDPSGAGYINLNGTVVGMAMLVPGGLYCIGLTYDGTTVRVYIDYSTVHSASLSVPQPRGVLLAGNQVLVDHLALFSTLLGGSADYGILAQVRSETTLDQTSGVRLADITVAAGVNDFAFALGELSRMPYQDWRGSAFDAMREVEKAEGGALFFSGAGQLRFFDRNQRALAVAVAPMLTVAADALDPADVQVTTDKQYLHNYVEGSRPNGATQVASDPTSVTQYGQHPTSFSGLLVTTDEEVRDRISWHLASHKDPAPRLTSASLDLLTQPQAVQKAALSLELCDHIRVTALPPQSPFAIADMLVEGWEERISTTEWTLTLNTVPASLYAAWRIEDPVYGAIDAAPNRIMF